MRIDGIRLREGSDVVNLTVTGGSSFPASPSAGELFFRTDPASLGLHQYNGASWELLGNQVAVGAVAPSSPLAGDLWYDTSVPVLKVWTGSAFAAAASTAGGSGAVVLVPGASATLAKDTHYVLTGPAAALTLPAAPAVGDELLVGANNGLATNTLLRNGSNIMGLAENCALDRANVTYHLRYVSAGLGWVFI
jgi:hypothetical protein